MQLVDNRLDETYLLGVQKFLDYAFQKTGEEYEIRCPCVKCYNTTLGTRKIVETHLIVYGIIRNYTFWYHHGERLGEPLSVSESKFEDTSEDEDGDEVEECESEDEVEELLRDLYPNLEGGTTHIDCDDLPEEEPNAEARKFYNLLKDFELPNTKIQKLQRWKINTHSGETKNKKGKKIALKSLRYFPLKPRLQRLFMSTKTSSLMTWHNDKRVDDGIMRHPADSMAWKSFDELHPSFAVEPRNVRLGLASDGFQPFRNSKTSHSIWPVVLIPYNLPPWLCMKQENFIFSMLILGPNGPGDAIDTYLQPLIEELKELWEVGIETYDASTKQNFKLHASLLWTINDFPAYGNLSGWSTKGKLACPCCNKDTSSFRLSNGKKQCFMGHQRYLSQNHKWRNDKDSFDGTMEKRPPPKVCSGIEILNQVQDLEGLPLSKDPKKRKKISHENREDNWNKKNLQEMNIRLELHPIQNGEKIEVPTACYTLSPEDKHKLCLFLKNLKVPNGFSSNISQCVNLKDHKISGLKSHDCHVLLQHLLPLALRGMLSKEVCEPLIKLFIFFSVLGSKELRIDNLEHIEAQKPITLCKLEKVFPPSFFDVMVHLPVHLATEAKIAGPIHHRWMYPVERWLYFLKSLIGNRACPEGCIAEGYIANECMTLCSRYLHKVETRFNHKISGLKSHDCHVLLQHLLPLALRGMLSKEVCEPLIELSIIC
ncbi:uncharacterized protein [Solanum tuberosum]|uniref:uncharacterized protein n=1 Tax=Solanum tuberosum TaxID=4113 RepID=UPI00073A0DEE|nr:PREDICTED: uncharacterized protein LOC107062233 [Solanum tuberosum]